MKTQAAVRRTRVAGQSQAGVDAQLYGAGLVAVGCGACAIGLWAAASLVGGLIASGGPVALITAWFGSVFGV